MSCPYATIFGEPGKGFHEKRIGDYAFNDTIGTFVLAGLTSYYFDVSPTKAVLGWFAVAEVSHYVFGVETAFLKQIGVKPLC